MNKQQAIEAMKNGAKVTHRLFDDNEHMKSNDDGTMYTFEDGVVQTAKEFWMTRLYQDGWDEGWELVMRNPKQMSGNYRDRWSKLPEGECELYEGDIVDLMYNPGIGSLHLMRAKDGVMVYLAGFSGYLLKPISLTQKQML